MWAAYKGADTVEPASIKKDTKRTKGRSELAPYFRRIDNYKHKIEFFQEPSGKYENKIHAARCKLQNLLGKKATTNIPAENPKAEVENISGGPTGRGAGERKHRHSRHLPHVRR